MVLVKNQSKGNKITKGSFALREADHKLIHYIETNESMLFNLRLDPGETNNIFKKEQEISRSLHRQLEFGLKKANENIVSGR